MARKKIVPKKLGPVKIPKNLRRLADKALADPHVVGIVSATLASVAALVAGREVVKAVPGAEAMAHAEAPNKLVSSVAEVVGKALDDIRSHKVTRSSSSSSGKSGKRKKIDSDVGETSSTSELLGPEAPDGKRAKSGALH